jgi:ATP-dependent RNA helicase DDX3X
MSDSDIRRFTKMLYGSSAEAGVNFAKYDDVPVELKDAPQDIEPLATFQDIESLPPYLALNIERCKYATPTPVQKYSVPLGMQGHDVMCCSQTGSGKTAAFLLPAVSVLSTSPDVDGFDEDEGMAAPRVVVLSPTRELAQQTQLEVQKLCFQGPLRSVELCKHPGVFACGTVVRLLCLTTRRCFFVDGGARAGPQLQQLALGTEIVVATPGRLTDFIQRGVITMKHVNYLVLDEADRMLDMGFEPQVREIVEDSGMKTPEEGRQSMLFSATFPPSMRRLASDFTNRYVWLSIGRVGSTTTNVAQSVEPVASAADKFKALESALERVDGQTIIFVRSSAALPRL